MKDISIDARLFCNGSPEDCNCGIFVLFYKNNCKVQGASFHVGDAV